MLEYEGEVTDEDGEEIGEVSDEDVEDVPDDDVGVVSDDSIEEIGTPEASGVVVVTLALG